MMPNTIVVPLDGSAFAERALLVAEAIATRIEGRLLLVSVFDHGFVRPAEYLDEIAARPGELPIETVAVTDQNPADAIVNIVGESTERIVCMTSHARGGLRWGMIGSVAEEVVRRAERPLLLVGRRCRDDFLTRGTRMLVCVDRSGSSARLAPVASEWADWLGLGLHAAIVVQPRGIEGTEHPEVLLDPIVEQFGGRDRVVATALNNGYPEDALADHAADLPAAIIAMNCYGRNGLARIALGSTTMDVLHLAPSPLLVVNDGTARVHLSHHLTLPLAIVP